MQTVVGSGSCQHSVGSVSLSALRTHISSLCAQSDQSLLRAIGEFTSGQTEKHFQEKKSRGFLLRENASKRLT